MKYLPNENLESAEVGRTLDRVLIRMLKENRGMTGASRKTRGRGAKVVPGRQIREDDFSGPHFSSSANTSRTNSQVERRSRGSTSRISRSASSSTSDEESDLCANCGISYNDSRGPDWIRCVSCMQWYCGICNAGSSDPSFSCSNCG